MVVKPSDIMTRAAFENAMVAVMALGGSTNAVLHLLAMARAVGVELSIDDFQKTYFVIDSFEKLREDCMQDFASIYDALEGASVIEPHELAPEDEVITRGTLEYFDAQT